MRKAFPCPIVVWLLLALPCAALDPKKPEEIRIHILNVGEGSCAVLECPQEGPTAAMPMIFDCGTAAATNAMKKEQVHAYLGAVLRGQPPVVVVSHPDRDHYSYLTDLDKTAQVLLGGSKEAITDQGFKSWLSKQDVMADFPVGFSNYMQPFEALSCGAAPGWILTVNAGLGLQEDGPVKSNADSLVAQIGYGAFRITFPGDATSQTLASILANSLLFNTPISQTLLVASHHGSNINGENGYLWRQTFGTPLVVYSAGANMGNPRCLGVAAYQNLFVTEGHPMRCWTGEKFLNWTSQEAEYLTQVSGTIVLTWGPTGGISIDCVNPKGISTGCQNPGL